MATTVPAGPLTEDPPVVDLPELTDGALLRMFARTRDEQAFRTLVDRYSALVLGACRRGTPSSADADDAFQATFIVLAQSASKIRRRTALGAWLYGVATRVCLRMRREHSRRQAHELVDTAHEQDDPLDELLARHDQAVADEELNALPETLRAPLVLRYLAGKSNAQVATELGITITALEGRLKRGKQHLRMRLIRRGVTLSALVAMLKATRVYAADVPAELVQGTAELCAHGTGATISSLASEPTTSTHFALQELNAMNTLLASKPLVAALAVSSIAALTVTAQLAFSQGDSASSDDAFALDSGANATAESPFDAEPAKLVSKNRNAANPFDDPAAESESQDPLDDSDPFDDSDLAASTGSRVPSNPSKPEQAATRPAGIVDLKPRSATELKIERTLPQTLSDMGLEFQDAPLSEVVDFLRTEYQIPIVLDNRALDDVGIPLDDPITINLRNIKLESALNLMLRQLDLTYIIRDEVLLITSEDEALSTLETRVYPTKFLGVSSNEVKEMLLETVASDSWVENKGPVGTISTVFSDRIVVHQHYDVHREINALLSQLKQVTEAESSTGAWR